jgi:hypothetical protein
MSKTKEKVETPKKEKKPKFQLEVEVNEKVYKGKAETLHQALTDFANSPDYPFPIKTRAIIRVSDGKNTYQQHYFLGAAQRLFRRIRINPTVSEIMSYKLSERLNG